MEKLRDLLGPELVRVAEENKTVDEAFFSALKEVGLIKDYIMAEDGVVVVKLKHELTRLRVNLRG